MMPALNPVKGTLQAINHGMVKFHDGKNFIRMWGLELTVSDTEDDEPRKYRSDQFKRPREVVVWLPNGMLAHLRNGGDRE